MPSNKFLSFIRKIREVFFNFFKNQRIYRQILNSDEGDLVPKSGKNLGFRRNFRAQLLKSHVCVEYIFQCTGLECCKCICQCANIAL